MIKTEQKGQTKITITYGFMRIIVKKQTKRDAQKKAIQIMTDKKIIDAHLL